MCTGKMRPCERRKVKVHTNSIQVNDSGTVLHSTTHDIRVGDILCTVDDAAFESGALVKDGCHNVEVLRFTRLLRMTARMNSLMFRIRKPLEYRPYTQL